MHWVSCKLRYKVQVSLHTAEAKFPSCKTLSCVTNLSMIVKSPCSWLTASRDVARFSRQKDNLRPTESGTACKRRSPFACLHSGPKHFASCNLPLATSTATSWLIICLILSNHLRLNNLAQTSLGLCFLAYAFCAPSIFIRASLYRAYAALVSPRKYEFHSRDFCCVVRRQAAGRFRNIFDVFQTSSSVLPYFPPFPA